MANQFSPFTQLEIEKMVAEYPLKGPNLYLEMDRSRLSVVSKARHLKVRYLSKASRLDSSDIRRFAYEGRSVEYISNALRVDKTTVWKACRENHIRIRDIHKGLYLAERSNAGKKNYFLRQVNEYGLTNDYSHCCICGWHESSIDFAHIHAAALGGEFTIANIAPLCPNHHRMFDRNVIGEQDKAKICLFQKKIVKVISPN